MISGTADGLPPDANPSLTADKMEFLEYFLNGKKVGGDPASCCKAIQETRRVDLSDWKADRRT